MTNKIKNLLKISGLVIVSAALAACSHHEHDHGKHDGHHHAHHHMSAKALKASQGIFDDVDVKDRKLSDWDGTWQSVYDLLIAGDLDEVMKNKAKKNKNKSFSDYKDYYTKGYKTDIVWIGIEKDKIDFHKKNAILSGHYEYSGYKILTYASGKKGVRYLFTNKNKHSKAPQYIQFSDHIIEPTKSEHFHLYMGNESHEKLFGELENWPTYYPLSLSTKAVVHEMLHH